jgi:thiol-disulfide isomerase/thioredoxin
MNRSTLLIFIALLSYATVGTAQGIKFHKKESWAEIKEIAKKEKKLILIDVFTDWCGPCKAMEEDVFSLPKVGDFYNQHFVNYKLDAEKGEGITLKEKFQVRLYPTYLFVDPFLDEVVHSSSSRQPMEVFLYTGQSALQVDTRSKYMQSQYQAGKRDPKLLLDYAKYLQSSFKRDELNTLVDTYLAANTNGLSDSIAWRFFVNFQNGTSSPQFGELIEKEAKWRAQYGNKAVDEKMLAAFDYDIGRLENNGIYNSTRFDAPAYQKVTTLLNKVEFTGKTAVVAKGQVLDHLRMKQYDQAAAIADRFPTIVNLDQKQVLAFYNSLYYPSRSIEDLSWMKHALKYVRYIAMNDLDNRAKPINHYNYALFLENYLTLCNTKKQVPDIAFLNEPPFGDKRYTLRSPDLKDKPKR